MTHRIEAWLRGVVIVSRFAVVLEICVAGHLGRLRSRSCRGTVCLEHRLRFRSAEHLVELYGGDWSIHGCHCGSDNRIN